EPPQPDRWARPCSGAAGSAQRGFHSLRFDWRLGWSTRAPPVEVDRRGSGKKARARGLGDLRPLQPSSGTRMHIEKRQPYVERCNRERCRRRASASGLLVSWTLPSSGAETAAQSDGSHGEGVVDGGGRSLRRTRIGYASRPRSTTMATCVL